MTLMSLLKDTFIGSSSVFYTKIHIHLAATREVCLQIVQRHTNTYLRH